MSTVADSPMPLSARLLEARLRRKLTQEEAARELGISTRSYQAYEARDARVPHLKTQRRIEAWLNGDGEAAA